MNYTNNCVSVKHALFILYKNDFKPEGMIRVTCVLIYFNFIFNNAWIFLFYIFNKQKLRTPVALIMKEIF